MIRADAQPIPEAFQNPRPRIDLYASRPIDPSGVPAEGISIHEKNRIWALVEEFAEGHGGGE